MPRIGITRWKLASAVFACATAVFAACVAAVTSHLAIDAAGDFALRHDSYDHMAHDSRFIGLLCAVLLGVASLLVLFAAAVKDARQNRGALRALVASYAHRPAWRLVAVVAPTTLLTLVAMESLDAWLAVGRLPGLADAFGGSVPLGVGITLCISSIAGSLLWRVLAIVSESHRTIACALERFLTRREYRNAAHASCRALESTEDPLVRISVLASRAGKRAPPLAA